MPPRQRFSVTCSQCCGDGRHGHARADELLTAEPEPSAEPDESDAGEAEPVSIPSLDDLAEQAGIPAETLAELDREALHSLDEALSVDGARAAADDTTANMGVLTRPRTADADVDGLTPPGILTAVREGEPDSGDGKTPRGYLTAD